MNDLGRNPDKFRVIKSLRLIRSPEGRLEAFIQVFEFDGLSGKEILDEGLAEDE